jgi:hypothetical protein
LHTIAVKEVADALTLQCYRRQEFKKISDAPSSPLSKMYYFQIEGDCRCTDIAVLPQSLIGGPAGEFPANIFEPGKISEKILRSLSRKQQQKTSRNKRKQADH